MPATLSPPPAGAATAAPTPQSPADWLAAIGVRVPSVASLWADPRGLVLAADLENPAVAVGQLDDWMRQQVAQPDPNHPIDRTVDCPHVRNLTLHLTSDAAGTIAVLTGPIGTAAASELMLLSRLALASESRRRDREQATHLSHHLTDTAALLEIVGRVQQCRRRADTWRTAAESVQQWLGADLVAVAEVGRRLTGVPTIAGRADRDPNSVESRRLRGAGAEALVAGRLTAFPAPEGSPVPLAHRSAARDCRLRSVLSVPLLDGAEPVAVLSVGWHEATPDDRIHRVLMATQSPLGTAIATAVRGRRRGMGRLADAVGRHRLQAVAIVAGVAATVGAMFVPVPYRLTCRAECRPVVTRATVAPHAGLLRSTEAEVGDVVAAGQSLGRMDDRQPRLELASVAAERERAIRDRDAKRAAGEIADALIADAEVERLKARTALLELRLRRAELRSPTAGVVLASPSDRGEMAPVAIGDVLFEVAPLDPIRLEVAIPIDRIDQVAVGQPVRFRRDGGSHTLDGTISRIQPRADVRDDAAVFVAELTLPNADRSLRPGTAGTARVTGDVHPLGWCLFHRAWEAVAVRLTL